MESIELKTWQDFRDYIDKDRAVDSVYYWRAQVDPSWPLASPIERIILNMFEGDAPGASKIYPYDGRYQRNGEPRWKEDFYQSLRDRYRK